MNTQEPDSSSAACALSHALLGSFSRSNTQSAVCIEQTRSRAARSGYGIGRLWSQRGQAGKGENEVYMNRERESKGKF